MRLLITYDIHSNGVVSLEALQNAIKQSSQNWWHYLSNVWIVDTELSIVEVHNRIVPMITSADRLLIIEVGSKHQGWLPADAWKWLKTTDKTTFIGKLLS